MFSSDTVIEVGAAVIEKNGRYLITQRKPDAPMGGLWEFPGGKKLPGESWEGCVKREVWEELGLTIEVEELMAMATHREGDQTTVLHFFRCIPISGEPKAVGCSQFRWILPKEMDDFPFPPANHRLIRVLQEGPYF
jgi:mutator protein MutT